MAMFNPPHPGEAIRTEIIEAHGLTVTAAANVLGVSRQALSGLLNGQADLTGEMALRIEKAFCPKMDTMMGMQSAFDIFQTRQRARSRFDRIGLLRESRSRLKSRPVAKIGCPQSSIAATRRGGLGGLRRLGAAPQFLQIFGFWKTQWHWAGSLPAARRAWLVPAMLD